MPTPPSSSRAGGSARKTGASSPQDTIEWRIKELRTFDVSRIRDRSDPELESLTKSVNTALAEVFGHNSPDYRKYALETLDTGLPLDFGGRYSVDELQQAVKENVERAIVNLKRVKVLLAGECQDFCV